PLLTALKDATAAAPPVPQGPNRDQEPMLGLRRAWRLEWVKAFYGTSYYKKLRVDYPVKMTEQRIGGVLTEVFVPVEGIAPANQDRVLINLHGGGFVGGSRIDSHLESVPIAALGRIKVVSIDYRLGPEFSFPAASEDVAAVYRDL